MLFHENFSCHLRFDDALKACKEFLKSNPSETILMSVKKEGEALGKVRDSYEKMFRRYYEPCRSIWYTANRIPMLENVRGKIVLLRRFELDSGTTSFGIDLDIENNTSGDYAFRVNPKQVLRYEDNYSGTRTPSKKMEYIDENIQRARKSTNVNELFLTFVSIAGVPSQSSKEINRWFHKRSTLKKGIYAFDFPDNERNLLSDIIAKNKFAGKACRIDFGGPGGTKPFEFEMKNVKRIFCQAGKYIGQIKLNDSSYGLPRGDKKAELRFQSGEYINSLQIRSGKYVDNIQFGTNKRRTFGPFKGKGGSLDCLDKIRVTKIGGRSDKYLEHLFVEYLDEEEGVT